MEATDGQRLWIDSASGVIVYREIFQAVKGRDPAQWPLFERHYFTRHVKCRDGIVLPTLVKVDSFTPARAPEQDWGKLSFQTVITVEEIRVNDDVSDEQFTLKVADGTDVIDLRSHKIYRVGDQVAGLDGLLASEGNGSTAARRWRLIAVLGVNVAVLALIAGYFLVRRISKRS